MCQVDSIFQLALPFYTYPPHYTHMTGTKSRERFSIPKLSPNYNSNSKGLDRETPPPFFP